MGHFLLMTRASGDSERVAIMNKFWYLQHGMKAISAAFVTASVPRVRCQLKRQKQEAVSKAFMQITLRYRYGYSPRHLPKLLPNKLNELLSADSLSAIFGMKNLFILINLHFKQSKYNIYIF